MNTVKIDLDNDCPGQWVPPVDDMERWLTVANQALDGNGRYVSISVSVIDEGDSARLNNQYRGKDKPTNVLSFTCQLPAEVSASLERVPLGDLAICAPVVTAEAGQQGKSCEAHWAHLLTHGFLHLNGYLHDTPEQADTMESLEIRVLDQLGFANPYEIN